MILRKLRLDKGWSQEQLAEISGVSTRTIQRIERGKTASLETLKCLASVFETDLQTLREDPPMTTADNPTLTPEDRAALNTMREWMRYDKSGYHTASGPNSETDTAADPGSLSEADRAALNKMHEWMQYDDMGYYVDPGLNSDERAALEYARDIKSFYINLWSYIIVMAGLLAINLLSNPSYIWAVWPALGWGIGVLMHGLTVFERFSFFNAEWERKQVEKRLRKK